LWTIDSKCPFYSFAIAWTACPSVQKRRIVGLYPNPFNAGSDRSAILSKERGNEEIPAGNHNGRAADTADTKSTLAGKPVFQASDGFPKR